MENISGTVTLSLKDYEELKKFEHTIKTRSVYSTSHYPYPYSGFDTKYYTENEVIESISTINDKLNEELKLKEQLISNLNEKNYSLTLEISKTQQEISRIQKMSVWQFLRWRKH